MNSALCAKCRRLAAKYVASSIVTCRGNGTAPSRSGRRRSLEAIMVGLGCRFPVLPVERADLEGGQIDTVDAPDVESPASWVEPGTNERVDPAVPAEIVLRRFRIELVEDEIRLAGEDTQIGLRRRVPERALPTTDRAVAIDHVAELGASLECDPTTVTCALVGLGHLLRGRMTTFRRAPTYFFFLAAASLADFSA